MTAPTLSEQKEALLAEIESNDLCDEMQMLLDGIECQHIPFAQLLAAMRYGDLQLEERFAAIAAKHSVPAWMTREMAMRRTAREHSANN